MVKQMKLSFASLLGAVALMAGCTDDDLVKPIVRGEGVQFGASASFEAGNDNRGSRTVYGDVIVDANGNKRIQLNWERGVDIIDIAYPEAAQSKLVAYDVLDEQHTTGGSQSVATTLGVHEGQSGGLQWGTPGTDGKHHFYAVYPSRKMFTENEQDRIVMDSEGFSGYMPNAQDPKEKTGDATQGYVLKPDMRYAYMVAKTEHADDAGAQVSLDFSPLVTALEFSITADYVESNTTTTEGITLQGIQLSSLDGNICGSFNYKFNNNDNKVVTDANPAGSTGFDQIYMNVPDGAVMKKGTKLDFTFFVVPTKNLEASKLKLTFVYLDTKGVLTYKTASIGRGIEMRKKYFFKNISFPVINTEASPSMWFSLLDNDILLDQLSIPVAGNAFTNNYTDADAAYHKQQVTDYQSLWNQGVRGFELVTNYASNNTSYSGDCQGKLENVYFVGGEQLLKGTGAPKFGQVVKNLLAFKASEKTKNECLFLICHYHAVYEYYTSWGTEIEVTPYSPQTYVTQLLDFFESLIGTTVTAPDGSTAKITADDFVLLKPGSTVGDLRGKVCIIVRPGDDEYMKWQKNGAVTSSLKLETTNGTSWADKALLIQDWGSAYDRWDKRYQGAVREATWANNINKEGTRIEDYLYGVSSLKEPYTAISGYDFKTDPWPEALIDDTRYIQTTNQGRAFVHEWMRVVPDALNLETFYVGATDAHRDWGWKRTQFLWVKWPSSINEKKKDIDNLFAKSVLGNDICFNVLSGYYVTKLYSKTHTKKDNGVSTTDEELVSAIPFKQSFYNIIPGNQGNGGNFAGLAADLNTYVYDKLTSDAYGVGPLGLVQIDFIGATAANFDTYDTDKYNKDHAKAAVASQNLVSFIAMNNFRFPMTRKPGTFSAPEVNDASLDENIAIQ